MKILPGLRDRITASVFAYLVIVSSIVVAHGHLVNERAEQLVWESLLESELAHFAYRRSTDRSYAWMDTDTLKLYGAEFGRPLPLTFANLAPGIHDEIAGGTGQIVTLISELGGQKIALALDITDIELVERDLAMNMAVWVAVVLVTLGLLTHIGAGWLVHPLSSLANTISSWSPDRSNQRVEVGASAPREAQVLATALNQYADRLESFLERERKFVQMASHELRTPIAVISGAAEVALDADGTATETEPYIEHILRTAQDMERLMTLLVALAKDPTRLREAAEPVDLGQLLPLIARDHEHIAQSKELILEIDTSNAPVIVAPEQIVRAAVGNLLRNAIENSDLGKINVSATEPAKIVVIDPGHGMSDEEMSIVYTKLARSGPSSAIEIGIGIDLITRLCEHLGWTLTLESKPDRGTTATLDFSPQSN